MVDPRTNDALQPLPIQRDAQLCLDGGSEQACNRLRDYGPNGASDSRVAKAVSNAAVTSFGVALAYAEWHAGIYADLYRNEYVGACLMGGATTAVVGVGGGAVGVAAAAAGGCLLGLITKRAKAEGGNWKTAGTTVEMVSYVGSSERAAVKGLQRLFGKESIGKPVFALDLGKKGVLVVVGVAKDALTKIIKSLPRGS